MEFLHSVFLPMLAGHLIADFWLQPDTWVQHKRKNGWKSGKLILHSGLASLLPVLFTFHLNLWWFFPVIFVLHFITDIFKSKLPNTISTFLADQLLHIAVLWGLAVFVTDLTISENAVIFWIYAAGFVLVTNPTGIFTGMFLNAVIPNKNKKEKPDVSAWIGILERILILIFILAGQFAAIGFLIAAKSIFRFNNTREEGNKKAEYFLLGTLLSFTLAIVVGLLINWLLSSGKIL
ncbi:Protein of unknown function [Tangfeifania diversioriginum]|uniref:DUF3307 domain-containing protein n=1 Tax=Tangfeifania diversioriginum TaxID=1168035 RepID=A0A1M6KUS6_9BACT|nr:DUF3307 domain-containing protein [Tangfeifania diversioriginum]SHJ62727.1 Protein of unknown function [Tangfeifania diversioriginum]